MWVFLLAGAVLLGVVPDVLTGDAQWYAAVLTRDAIIAIVSFSAWFLIPYQKIKEKLVWTIWSIWQVFIFISQAAEYYTATSPNIWATISALICALMVGWAFSRQYTIVGHYGPIDPNTIYYVLTKPYNLRSLLLCLFFRSYNGVKIYLNKKLYCYRKGVFSELDEEKLSRRIKGAIFVRIRDKTPEDMVYLQSILGTHWSVKNNCYRLLESRFGSIKNYLT